MRDVDSGIHHVIISPRPSRVIRTASDDSCGGGQGTRLKLHHWQGFIQRGRGKSAGAGVSAHLGHH